MILALHSFLEILEDGYTDHGCKRVVGSNREKVPPLIMDAIIRYTRR
jgi:hypothetical protein